MTLAERNALVIEAMPEVRKLCRSYAALYRLEFDPMVSDGYLAVLTIANEYDAVKGHNDWLGFVRARLRPRLIDIHRRRVGREYQPTFERRYNLYYALSLEAFAEATEHEDGWWPEPADYSDPCDEIACSDAFTHFLGELDARTREMVALRLDGWRMTEIGERYGITESRVSQIFARLRPMLERELVA